MGIERGDETEGDVRGRAHQDHLAFDVVPGLTLGQAGQHSLQGHLNLAQPLAVGGGGERDLRVPGPVRSLVGAELSRDPGEVLRPPQAVPDQLVVRGELAEAAEGTAPVGDGHPVAVADDAERVPPDRALEVDVQMGLGQQRQVTHGPQHKRRGSPSAREQSAAKYRCRRRVRDVP